MEQLNTMINSIEKLDEAAMIKAKNYLDHLSKPIGSLGALEDLVVKLSGIKGEIIKKINKKSIVIMCADNGIEKEGVSSCPREVTAIVTQNIADGTTAVCKLSEYYGSDVELIDIGVDKDLNDSRIRNKKIRYGTDNMLYGPAMTRDEAIKAINIGIETVKELKERGYDLIGTGEMGIGNTTTAAAIISIFSGVDSDLIVGKGSGLTEEGLCHKREIVKKVLEVNKPNKEEAIEVLSKVGGFDIAGLCGVFLGGAIYKIPIVIDGLIASAAALCAKGLCATAGEYMIGSHLSAEPGAQFAMEALGVQPLFSLGMRLGEGTGCPIAFSIVEGAVYTMSNMASFSESGVDESDYIDIREKEAEGVEL